MTSGPMGNEPASQGAADLLWTAAPVAPAWPYSPSLPPCMWCQEWSPASLNFVLFLYLLEFPDWNPYISLGFRLI